MNEHEMEQGYDAQAAKMKEKYAANIESFYKAHGYDASICFDMLVFNGHCFIKGINDAVIKGGGAVNVPELVKDVKILDQFTVWQ